MSNDSILFHIGYHKTGTTWLQAHLFTNSDLGLRLMDRDFVRTRMMVPGPFEFDANGTREQFNSMVSKIEATQLTPVISNEGLSGSPHAGGYNSKELADRIYAVCPQARILIVVREQQSAILSNYAQYVSIGGRASLQDYVQPKKRWQTRIPLFRLEHFKYHLLVSYYKKLFGANNVTVLPYELFVAEPEQFVERVLNSCRVPVKAEELSQLPFERKENKKRSASGLETKRLLNVFYPLETFHNLQTNTPQEAWRRSFVDTTADLVGKLCPPSLDDALNQKNRQWLKEFLADTYAESNAIISADCGLELSRWGYRLVDKQSAKIRADEPALVTLA
ncbi:MAG: sulfotransferase [Cyanobacteria bacterium]|nr:sulfotransferase [Cyanobacteriota bacterium]